MPDKSGAPLLDFEDADFLLEDVGLLHQERKSAVHLRHAVQVLLVDFFEELHDFYDLLASLGLFARGLFLIRKIRGKSGKQLAHE